MQRLKNRAQFQATLSGDTVARTAHFALHRFRFAPLAPVAADGVAAGPLFGATDCPWLGAMVPKRWAKRAVTRNAIKRQIYNVAGELQPPLPVAAHVVRLRAAFDRSRFPSATSDALKAAVRGELQQLFQRADGNAGERPAARAAASV